MTISAHESQGAAISVIHTELGIRNSERNLLLILDLIQEGRQLRCDLALDDGCSLLHSSRSTVKLLESLQLESAQGSALTFIGSKTFATSSAGSLQRMVAFLKWSAGLHIQIGDTLSSGGILRKTMLEELLILGLQQGIARTGLSENEEGHGERPRRARRRRTSVGVQKVAVSNQKGTEKKVWTVDAFTVEERSRNFAQKKKCKSTSHSSGGVASWYCGTGIT